MRAQRSVGFRRFATLLARFALGASYLSAVADRFALWGAHGAPGVVWGDFQHFVGQVASFLPFLPKAAAFALAWVVTVFEASIGLALIIGLRTSLMALASGCLLLTFALAMAFSPGGIHSAFASSVWSAAAASMLLAYVAEG